MARQRSLRTKLLTIGLITTVLPLIVIVGMLMQQSGESTSIAAQESARLSSAGLDQIVHDVHAMCEAQQEIVEQNTKADLNVAQTCSAARVS